MRSEYLTQNFAQTQRLGRFLAKEILKTKKKKGAFVLGLVGDLGGGKTTFLQGFAKGLGIKQKILSPTFIIMKKFLISLLAPRRVDSQFLNFYHFDCYRIQKPKEILDLEFKEIIAHPQNIVAIEWADRIEKILPKNSLILKFKFLSQRKRKIKLEIKK